MGCIAQGSVEWSRDRDHIVHGAARCHVLSGGVTDVCVIY